MRQALGVLVVWGVTALTACAYAQLPPTTGGAEDGEHDPPPAEPYAEPSATTPMAEAEDAPTGTELAALDEATCFARLDEAEVAYEHVPPDEAAGVTMPLRLTGPIGGVEIRGRDRPNVHGIIDCRLALALLAWAPHLRALGIHRIEHFSIYRPRARIASSGRPSGHASGMAIDLGRIYLDDGSVIDVLEGWGERTRGAPPCPVLEGEAPGAALLRGVVCEAVEQQRFHVILTPHFDRAHQNHVHLELRADATWQYVR